MRKYLLLILTCFLFSCSNQDEKSKRNLEKDLFTFFDARLKDADGTIHLDSVRILKFDTITANTILFKKIMLIYDDIDKNQNKIREVLSDMNDAKQMMRLTAGLNSALYNNSLDDFKKKNTEMISLQDKDSVLIKTTDSLSEKLKTTDSTTLFILKLNAYCNIKEKIYQ